MGAQPDPTTTTTTTTTRKRKAASRTSSSDSIQITKIRKTGRPAFSPSPTSSSDDDPIPPPTKVTKTYLSRKPAVKPATAKSTVAKSTVAKSAAAKPSSPPPPPPPSSSSPPEKRPKRFRPHPPQSVQSRLHRALSQRLIVLSRTGPPTSSPPTETFTIAGSTGNVYTISIGPIPSCDCPDGGNGRNTCKHILYILSKVLKAREGLVYQAGLLNSELSEIFTGAPRGEEKGKGEGGRKPLGQDDCPICYSGFREGEGEEVTWCKAMCGTNVHKGCFDEWRRMVKGAVTCVMCRTPWEEEVEVGEVVVGKKKKGRDGYVNVAGELGISTVRDMSTYSEWFTGRRGYGFGRY
ncbi:hypothetical protein K440DRAFT_583555 [Wilcoxina mikolae CBS 423.85]|nr:hypothetical protein K440DRAFT_583555 [Wilcoxina mikolae CBS 423.85]